MCLERSNLLVQLMRIPIWNGQNVGDIQIWALISFAPQPNTKTHARMSVGEISMKFVVATK